jgi:hypothetical protein
MENIISRTTSKIAKGLEEWAGGQSMNKQYMEKLQNVRSQRGVQNRQSTQVAAKIAQTGAALPDNFSSIKTPSSIKIQIDTSNETGDTRVLLGKGERFFDEIDPTWVANKSVIQNIGDYDRFLDAMTTDTLEFDMLVLKALPTNSTDSANADAQLDEAIVVHQFGMKKSDYSRSELDPYLENDITAVDQLSRAVGLTDISVSRWNAYTCWEMTVKKNVKLTIGLVTRKRINGRY